MLKKDPDERISMFDLLLHPWLRKYQRDINGGWDTSDDSIMTDSVQTLEDKDSNDKE